MPVEREGEPRAAQRTEAGPEARAAARPKRINSPLTAGT